MAGDNNEDNFLDELAGLDFNDVYDDTNDKVEDSSDIESILNALTNSSDNAENKNAEDFDKTDLDSSDKKKKKKGLFSKNKEDKKEKKSKKEKKNKKSKKNSDESDLESAKILEETGSTAEDMKNFKFEEADLLKELDGITEIDKKDAKAEKRKKKKEKKAKKIKEKAAKDGGRVKITKPKIVEPPEILYISPVLCILLVTIIAFAIVGLFFGGNAYRYSTNIENASEYYVEKEYDKAYEILSGMKLNSSDEGFYNQVKNIMYVKKHINDFNAYIELEKYGDALEALLRGIQCYDKNIGKANELGTVEILNSLLDDIDTSLKSYYSLSMEEAREINLIENKSEAGDIITKKAQNIKLSKE